MNDPYETPSVTDAPPPPPSAALSSDERMWAMLGHLSALIGLIFPFGNIIAPLVVWQVKKDTMPFAASEAKEALNFNITWSIYLVVLTVVGIVLSIVGIGILLLLALPLAGVAMVVLAIIAGLKANEGRPYRYPMMMLRLVN
jgi:uncharacterized Tic20 family protein